MNLHDDPRNRYHIFQSVKNDFLYPATRQSRPPVKFSENEKTFFHSYLARNLLECARLIMKFTRHAYSKYLKPRFVQILKLIV